MFIPKWLLVLALLVFSGLAAWTGLLVAGRNPLPFPDNGSRIFAASSPEAKAAAFLIEKGFSAEVVYEIEPGLPIVFVLTDALSGSVINFRKHVTQMPMPE